MHIFCVPAGGAYTYHWPLDGSYHLRLLQVHDTQFDTQFDKSCPLVRVCTHCEFIDVSLDQTRYL
jgi:hypothetical protein